MADNRSRKLFVNLAVRDLKKSMEFFSKLGFEFNPAFTDDKAACMIISDEAYVMLLSEPFFKTFTKRELCDTTRHTEGPSRSRAAAGPRWTRWSRTPYGQTSARWQVLGAIDHESRTVSQIARVMGLARQSVQRTADRLQTEGLVTYVDNSVLDWITQRQVVWANELGACVRETELRRALRVIQTLREMLERANQAQRTGRPQGRPSADRRAIPRPKEV